jgi:hypothetical protein
VAVVPAVQLSANQVVAYNLRRARERSKLTQEAAGALLEPWLGTRWSRATFSTAERSAERPERQRQFTADDLLAFSCAFRLPLAYFLVPPSDALHITTAGEEVVSLPLLLDALFGFAGPGGDALDERLAELPSSARWTSPERAREAYMFVAQALLMRDFADISGAAIALRSAAATAAEFIETVEREVISGPGGIRSMTSEEGNGS